MKLRRLDLIAYGPFTDLSLDLSAGSEGLHLIFGPNEAGKSSALRAIHDLFYGIELRTKDNFLHEYNQLRIGAEISDREGNLLAFRRRKRNRNTLVADDDETVIDPDILDRFLGGVDSETFGSLFGIDHAQLVKGARSILEGQGQVGQLLFSAGSGLTGLRDATHGIQAELDELFKKQAQKPAVNRLLNELGDLRKQVQEHQLPGEEWTRHDDALREALRNKVALDRRRMEQSRERNRLTRIRDALKPIAERDEILARLGPLADVVLLPPEFADRHREVRESLTRATALAEQAEADLEEAVGKLEAITVPEALLARAEVIEELHQRLGQHLKAKGDRANLINMKRSDEHEARSLLVALGKPRDLDEAEPLRLRADLPDRIRELGRQDASLNASFEQHRQTLDSLSRALREHEGSLEAIGPTPDLARLRREVDRLRKLGDPDAQLATARRQIEADRRQLDRDHKRLPHWGGSIDDLIPLAVPLEETIEQAEQAQKAIEKRLQKIDQKLETNREEADRVATEIRAFRLQGEVPTEADVKAARTRRDAGWQLIRTLGLDPDPAPPEADSFINKYDPACSLAEAFERSIAYADDRADRLRREADRVASHTQQIAHQERLEQKREELNRSRSLEAEQLEAARASWEEQLQARGLPGLDPPAFRAWNGQRSKLVAQAEILDRQEQDARHLSGTIAEHRRALDLAFEEASLPARPESESLTDCVEQAASLIAEAEARRVRIEELVRAIDRARRDRDVAGRELQQTEHARAEWREAWAPLMQRLGLEPDATPTQADGVLDRIDQLFNHLEKARGFQSRIDGMDRDANHFFRDVLSLCEGVAPDLAEHPPEEAVANLYQRLGRARDVRKERDVVASNRDEADRKRRSAAEMFAANRSRLEALCREARCDDPDELAKAEAASADRARCEADLRRVEDQIRGLGAGTPLDDFIAEALDVERDSLELQIETLNEEIDTIEHERSQLDQAIGAEKEWQSLQKGGDEAADSAERMQGLLAELRTNVEDYAALRIAQELLRRGIEQFREEHQGPVIERAGRLFADLSAGSFRGLSLDEDDHGRPILLGIRNENRPVGVDAMSDGSCDQLYLALRLASLEGWLARHEPIPLIADDILLNFDDERSAAALLALAELSRKTQILFFTHHEHLVELARSLLPADLLFVHRLDRVERVGVASM